MDTYNSILLATHVAAGFSSLVIFWLPMMAKKGSKWHVRSGKAYVIGMWIVVITAALLSINNALAADYVPAGFLGFISILTAIPLWYGIQIVKEKREVSSGYYQTRRLLHLMLVIAAAGLLMWGIVLRLQGMAILFVIFGVFGLTSISDVRMSFATLKQRPWIVEHLTGMLNTAIAAHTAFLVFGGANFLGEIFQGYAMVALWVAPGIIGTLIIAKMSKKFRPQTIEKVAI